jgi:2-dehydro-3-deoxyphosphogluconate aldolase/(4S)-4-hydroxy-2-oxoglutarate aldolase
MLGVYKKANHDNPLPAVQQVVDAGASYLVSAVNFSDESYEKFAGRIPMIPGCGTATEIVSQSSKGANLCKIFPAKQLGGPAFVKAIDPAIHKTISLVPTGGTNAGNIPDYIDVGVLVLGGSFSMIEKTAMEKIVEEQDYGLLADELTKIKQLIDNLRAEKWPNIDFAKASVEQISQVAGRNFNITLKNIV